MSGYDIIYNNQITVVCINTHVTFYAVFVQGAERIVFHFTELDSSRRIVEPYGHKLVAKDSVFVRDEGMSRKDGRALVLFFLYSICACIHE